MRSVRIWLVGSIIGIAVACSFALSAFVAAHDHQERNCQQIELLKSAIRTVLRQELPNTPARRLYLATFGPKSC